MAPSGGSTQSTSVFNMVLNTIGASSFGQALQGAQNGINAVTVSLNKATTAAQQGRVNNELQSATIDKLNANYERSATRLDLNRGKLDALNSTVSTARANVLTYESAIDALNIRLGQQTEILARLDPASKGFAGLFAQIDAAIKHTSSDIVDYMGKLDAANKTVEEGGNRQKMMGAQIDASTARLNAQKVTLDQLKQPLTTFESLVATGMQVYNIFDKIYTKVDQVTVTISRVQRIIDKLKETAAAVTGRGNANQDAGVSESASAAALAIGGVGNVVSSVTNQFSVLGVAIGTALGQAFINIVNTATGALRALGDEIISIGQNVIEAAGRFDELTITAQLLGSKAGYTGEQINDLITSIRKQGIEAATAATEVADFARYNLDMANAVGLAKVAQDAAIYTGANSTATLAQLSEGIVRHNSLILRTAGLNVNLAAAEKLYADKLHISTDALTEEQKVQATLNAVLLEGVKIQGSYDAALQSPTKQLGSLPRLINDVAVAVGEPFQKAFLNVILGVNSFTKKMAVAFQPGGGLEPVVRGMGVLANLITDHFQMISDSAVAWGTNLVNQFANGMLNAMGSIFNALGAIGNAVSYWLSPGSPPKLLPDIGEWGKSAINEFFKGFALPDFSFFDAMGSDVEKHLRSMTVIKEPSDKIGILNNVLGERGALASATAEMDKFGSVSESTFQRVFAAMGGASQELQNYIRSSFALEEQNRTLTKAQDELDAATKKYNDLLKPIDDKLQGIANAQADLQAEQQKTMLNLILNDPNATAAEKDQARLQIEKLNAEERQRLLVTQAKKEIDAAQAKVDAETLKQRSLMDTLATQKDLLVAEEAQVALMQEYYDLLKQIANQQTAAAGGGGGGPGKPPTTPPFGGGVPFAPPKLKIEVPEGIVKLIQAFELMKIRIIAAWEAVQKALKPVTDAWDRFGQQVEDTKNDFATYIPEIESWVGKLIAETVKLIGKEGPKAIDNMSDTIKNLQGVWDKNHKLIEEITLRVWLSVVRTFLFSATLVTAAVDIMAHALNTDWAFAWDKAIATVVDFLNFFKKLGATWLMLWVGIVHLVFGAIVGMITGDFTQMIVGIAQILITGGQLIKVAFTIMTGFWLLVLKTFFSDTIEKLRAFIEDTTGKFTVWFATVKVMWDNFWSGGYKTVETTTGQILTDIGTWLANIFTAFQTGMNDAMHAFALFWRPEPGETFWGHVQKGTAEILTLIGTWLTDLGSKITDNIPALTTIGENLMMGLINGAGHMALALISAVTGPITDAIAAARLLLGMHSPSTVMAQQLGVPMMQGVAMGMSQSAGLVSDALTRSLSASIQMASPGGGSVSGNSYSTSNTTNFNYSPTYGGAPSSVNDNFALMRAMVV